MMKTIRLFSILMALLFVLGSLISPDAGLSCPPEEAFPISGLRMISSPGLDQMALIPVPVCSDCHPVIIHAAVGAAAMASPETASSIPSASQERPLTPGMPAASLASSTLEAERGPPPGKASISCLSELKSSNFVFQQLKGVRSL